MSAEERKNHEANARPPAATDAEDSDPGYEDLDDILDQFDPASRPATAQDAPPTAPAASGPGRPPLTSEPSNQSEAEFMAQLQAELAKTMSSLGVADGSEAKKEAADAVAMGKELEEFTAKMEKEGLQPEDLLRAILGEEGLDPSKLNEALGADASSSSGSGAKSSGHPGAAPPLTADSKGSFDETIRKTLERMQESDTSARDAAHSTSDDDQDILAQLMKAMESMDQGGGAGGGVGGEPGDDSDLSNLFLNMMHQLTSKELLYEPMKELNEKFPDWLQKNRGTLKKEDLERYQTQQSIVKEIVSKFEESSYSDSNEKDRSFIWEKMQTMQAAGSPPEDLIQAPFPGAFGPGTGSGEDPLGGCPTQ